MSVIIGTFGDDAWADLGMGPARTSALEQTCPALEVLNIHDHSLKMARNRGAWEAKGDWLVFLDADDMLDYDYLRSMSKVMELLPLAGVPAALLYPSVSYDGATPVELKPQTPHPLPRQAIRGGNWMVIGTAITRELFWECGGFGDEQAWEDWSLWMRATMLGARPVHIPDAIYRAHSSPSGRNSTVRRPRQLFDGILRANDEWLKTRRQP